MSNEKAELRARGLAKRRTMSGDECAAGSRQVIAHLRSVPQFAASPLILTYVSNEDNEVETRSLIEALIRDDRRVGVPATSEDEKLVWHEIGSLSDLQPGRFGIFEPDPKCTAIERFPEDTVILVPGILFSVTGARIGYGRGCFDRFLRRFPGVAIGLAFDFQIQADLPVEGHDRLVDFVVSESVVFDCWAKRLRSGER